MLTKKQKRNLFLDRLHKGFVCTCVVVALYATTVVAVRGYKYFAVEKPTLKEKERETLLAEGASDNLKDIASTLKA